MSGGTVAACRITTSSCGSGCPTSSSRPISIAGVRSCSARPAPAARARPRLRDRRFHGGARARRRRGGRRGRRAGGARPARPASPGRSSSLVVPLDGPLPFEDCSFELVWASEVIEHVADTARVALGGASRAGPRRPAAADDAVARAAAASPVRGVDRLLRAARRSPAPVHAPLAGTSCSHEFGFGSSRACERSAAAGRAGATSLWAPAVAYGAMRVLIDDTYARRAPHSGTAVYVSTADRGALLAGGRGGRDGRQPAPRATAGRGWLGSARNLLADRWWEEIELPRRARARRRRRDPSPAAGDHTVPAVPQSCHRPRPRVRAAAGRCSTARCRRYALSSHRAAARRAGAVICVSSSDRAADVSATAGASPAERIVVAPHGPGPGRCRRAATRWSADALPVRRRRRAAQEPRDAARGVRAATATRVTDPLELVLAGSATATGDGVRVERDVDAARLGELYAGAAALVHTVAVRGLRADAAGGDGARARP